MLSRSARALAVIAVSGAVALAIVGAASPAGATTRPNALLAHCVRVLLGVQHAPATPATGSADPQLVSQFAIFRRTRSHTDDLPAAARLRLSLAYADARTYDPSAAVLLSRSSAGRSVYAVPATMVLPALPAGCAGLPQLANAGAYLGLQAQETGSGPGACLVTTQLEQGPSSGAGLPGAPSKPARRLIVAQAGCASEAILSGYRGTLGEGLRSSQTRLALIPDGISTITYTRANGRQFTVTVAGNVAPVPAALSTLSPVEHVTSAELGRLLAAALPTTVTETGPGGAPVTTLTRPPSLILDSVADFTFLRRLLSRLGGFSGSSSTGTGSVACSAQTHRCVSVTVTTACDSHERCRTFRTIRSYRYVGSKPPRGTAGAMTLPTAPVVARIDQRVARPRRLTLVLSGAPHRRVIVVVSVSCFARNSQASGGGPVLTLAVPSRTAIRLPGAARSFRACVVSALVTSTQRRGPVRVNVARG